MRFTEQKRLKRTTLAIATSLFCAGLAPAAWAEGDANASDTSGAAAETAAAKDAPTAPDAAGSSDAAQAPQTLANIIVTAQKREQAAIDVPASVTSVDTKQLTRNGLTRIQDYSAEIPGLSTSSGRPGQTQVTIRGITTGTAQGAATTGIYLDEAPVGSINAYTVGSQLVPDIDPSELSRIEVLKGPQGTLYGAGAMGGLLRYVTANPKYDQFSGSVTLGATTVEHGADSGLGRFYVNAPVGDSTALQIGGFLRNEPGYIDTVQGDNDVNSYQSKGGRFALNWLVNDDWKVQASAFTHRIDADGNNLVDVDAHTLKPLYGEYTQNARVDQPSETELDLYNLTVKGRLGIFDVVSSTTYQTFDSASTADVSDVYGVLLGAVLHIPDLGVKTTQFTETERWSQEVRFDASALDGRLTYQFGGYWTDEDDTNKIPSFDPFQASTGQPITLPFYLAKARIDSTYEEWSGFANATYAFTPKFSVQGGIRYSDDHQTYAQDYSGAIIGPVPLIQKGEEDGTQTTYLLSASYKPSDDQLVYGRVATGYRPGGPNAVPPPSVFPAPNTFDPDELTSYELGYKGVFADGRVSFEGALFTTNWKDIQIQTSAGGFNFFVNGGKANSKGAEASLLWYPIDALSLRATYAHTKAELTEDAPLAGGKDGDELPFVPENTFSLSALYQWRVFDAWNASFGGSLDYIGERQSNYSQKASVTVPDYTTVNLNASLENDHWRFTLYGRNLNDSDGITALGQRGLLPGMNPYSAGLITPRTFGVEASYKF